MAAAILVAKGIWDAKKMVNVEELDPEPFVALLDQMGLVTDTIEKNVKGGKKKKAAAGKA